MAKVTAPLLSLAASGKIANTLVASVWKGVPYMRQYVVPANPNTPAQSTHRACFTAAVAAWRSYLTGAPIREDWRVFAGIQSGSMSNFNAAAGEMVTALKADGDASFVVSKVGTAGVVVFTLKNMDDGATGDESGDFDIWTGTKPTNMTKLEVKTISAGTITTSDLGTIATVVYVAVTKVGTRNGLPYNVNRSGIYKYVIEA